MILQSELYHRRRKELKKGYELACKAVDLALKENNSLLLIQAYFAQMNGLILLGYASELSKSIENMEDLIETYFKNENEYLSINIKFRGFKSFYYNFLKKYDLALNELLSSIELQRKSNKNKGLLLHSLTNVCILYKNLGEYQQAIENLLNLIESINKEKDSVYNEDLSYALVILGDIYTEQGELDKALECSIQSLDLTSNYLTKFNGLINIGFIFLQKGYMDESIKYFREGIDLTVKEGGQDAEIYGLTYLLMAYILKKEKTSQEFIFEKISTLYNKNLKNEFYLKLYLFSKALLLKESSRFSDKAEAQKSFQELIKDKTPDFFIIQSYLNYLELLFDELKYSNDESVLKEIEQINLQLMTRAQNNSLHTYIAESLLIKAKISILKLNLEEARQLLDKAQNSAESKGLKLLSQKISKEHDNLLNKMNQWEDIVNESMSFQDRLELANMEDFLRNMIKKSVSNSQEERDQGLIFLIVNFSGLSIFSKRFVERDELDDQLIAGLLSAINSFSQDTFKTDQPIERIKQGDNTLLIKRISNFNLCYVFKGPSYFANQKMNKFFFKIKENEEIVYELTNSQNLLSIDTIEMLNKIINENFKD